MREAVAAELLAHDAAWPLGRAIARRRRFSTGRLPLHDRLARLDRFGVFQAHAFEPDRLGAEVQARATFEETYARPVRPRTDGELPPEVLDALQNERMPQFTLRNIGRVEREADPEQPLPFARERGLGGDVGRELDEVRRARLPRPELAQVWSTAFVGRVRSSLRRLLLEDPWELRYGPEATAEHAGPGHRYVVEGTHPDDLPGAPWGPEPVPAPDEWVPAPPGEPPMEHAPTLRDTLQRLSLD